MRLVHPGESEYRTTQRSNLGEDMRSARLHIIGLVLVCAIAAIPHTALAIHVTIDGYRREMAQPDGLRKSLINFWLDGLFSGLQWANAARRAESGDEWFCLPPKMIMSAEQVHLILDDYIRYHALHGDDGVELTLLLALQDSFPCHK